MIASRAYFQHSGLEQANFLVSTSCLISCVTSAGVFIFYSNTCRFLSFHRFPNFLVSTSCLISCVTSARVFLFYSNTCLFFSFHIEVPIGNP